MDQDTASASSAILTPTVSVSDAVTSNTPTSDAPVSSAPVSDISTPGAVNPATANTPEVANSDDSTVVAPNLDFPDTPNINQGSSADLIAEVAKKITESQNVLVALSSNPSVDEMAAAIGLSLFLDRLGKRATAIYSGSTPNALEFLKPEETFEPSIDALQDFVIALNKEKADHLRYKLDGDYVKIFITPYKTRIGENDLEFSYGDFNVDLVLALDVANGVDLDAALREHGRIMHDAVIINITTGNPGKFGEIEWSDKSASSVSEMIAKLLYGSDSKTEIEKEEATAFLTGIVAATNRFSNAKTTSETMQISSRLMQSGANQQLVSKNITPDVDNEIYSLSGNVSSKQDDPTKLDIDHTNEEETYDVEDTKENVTEESDNSNPDQDSELLNDLKAAEASLAQGGKETTPELVAQPVKIDSATLEESSTEPVTPTLPPLSTPEEPTPEEPKLEGPSLESTSPQDTIVTNNDNHEKVVQPLNDMGFVSPSEEGTEKYGKMLENALSGLESPNSTTEATPITNENPAVTATPQVASNPEINGVPEINYMPMPGEEVLPPPPTPPINMDYSTPTPSVNPTDQSAPVTESTPIEPVTPITPATPIAESTPAPTPLGPQPAMQDQVYTPQANDPGAFKIPGM